MKRKLSEISSIDNVRTARRMRMRMHTHRHSLPAAGSAEPLSVGGPGKEIVGGPPIISALSASIVF